jgi:PadR family transcriptional regulator PadR
MASDRVAQLRKGVLELAILGLLRAGESYGGEIVLALSGRPGLDASAGTVYPILSRLKTSGLVDTTWVESASGPPRKYYRLSTAGSAALTEGTQAWRGLVHALDSLLEEKR